MPGNPSAHPAYVRSTGYDESAPSPTEHGVKKHDEEETADSSSQCAKKSGIITDNHVSGREASDGYLVSQAIAHNTTQLTLVTGHLAR